MPEQHFVCESCGSGSPYPAQTSPAKPVLCGVCLLDAVATGHRLAEPHLLMPGLVEKALSKSWEEE